MVRFLVKGQIRSEISSLGFRTSEEFLNKLDDLLGDLIQLASESASGDYRKTLMEKDIKPSLIILIEQLNRENLKEFNKIINDFEKGLNEDMEHLKFLKNITSINQIQSGDVYESISEIEKIASEIREDINNVRTSDFSEYNIEDYIYDIQTKFEIIDMKVKEIEDYLREVT